MPADDQQELFDVCDGNDVVIGQATRGEVHQRGLLHRAVHIFVFNSRGELLLHRRSAGKDEYPLRFTSSASGHLSAGEDYHSAAVRELEEELGLTSPLEFLTSLPAGPETANEHSHLYRTQTDDMPTPDPFEIESIEYVEVEALARRVAESPEKFTPPFRLLLGWYLNSR
ncbi:MAG: NUDIX domain-containing protein [Planctomycetota bacterium]|nr:MAG: NUDIX domain-containing protein [Planctomycetota bacterium]REJ90585.1 MAG: NUDIX domain-containing protein [Planctomycetota bacterium]REK21427.1 MAG: NUDIX domain-containing protein [Planctomycetota bacterium]REK40061.1 MAG: NUDIX domain-containing protein [Planctomycetota bacterium]